MKQWLKKAYRAMPVIRELSQILATAREIRDAGRVNNYVQINTFFNTQLAHNPRYADRRKLNHWEHQVFSQNGEDGIIAEIIRRIGPKSRRFVEVGTGDGLENNTVNLLSQGWQGAWIDGDQAATEQILARLARPLAKGDLKLKNAFVTAENINKLFEELGVPPTFDLLSLDIDRNTFHVWKALQNYKPRVVIVEYNSTFPPDVEWAVEYDAARTWDYSAHFGASLKAFERLGETLGYALVGCDFSGTNAFFVAKSEKLELFADAFTAENHYEPPRYWSLRREAHRRNFDDR